jgi:hypothetical protein
MTDFLTETSGVASVRRVLLVVLALGMALGCSGDNLIDPRAPALSISAERKLSPRAPKPTPAPNDTLSLRGDPPLSFGERLGWSTLVAPHLTTLPIDPLGNNDYVHPDLIRFTGADTVFSCAKDEMIVTPYKGSNGYLENPTLLCRNTTRWFPPYWLKSPLIDPPGLPRINSDPDMFFDRAMREKVITYREVGAESNIIKAVSTLDGHSYRYWGTVFEERAHNAVSPTSVLEPDRSLLSTWYVQAGAGGCQTTESRVALREAVPEAGKSVMMVPWKFKTVVNVSQPGYIIWHIDVIKIADAGYLMLAAAYPKGSDCGHSDLFLYISRNRIDWESFAVPFMWRNMPDVNVKTLYRGSLLFDEKTGVLDVVFSAMSLFGDWKAWEAEYSLPRLITALRSATPSDMPKISSSRGGVDLDRRLGERPFIAP